MRRGALAAALAAAGLLAQAAPAAALPPIKHVFIVILENENAATTFGPKSEAPYLAHTLRARGAYVPGYFGTAHLSLANYIAMISGQGPNPITQADAPAYTDFLPGTPGPDGQALGSGSVYPASVKTIADQLGDKGLTWRGYMEDMGNSATQSKTCRHPANGAPDDTQSARQGDQYATRHNPFVYFHSIIDDQAKCDANVVPLGRLTGDLESTSTTPNYSFITPNLCHDGHDEPCKGSNEPGGLKSADAFLKKWIPKLTASPAYRDGGLVLVTFDEAVQTADASACCGEKQGPNTPNNGGPKPGAGGGRVGAVLLSPFIKPGTQTKHEYNHYSMLRSFEEAFGLGRLGFAAATGLRPFGSDIYTNPKGKPQHPIRPPSVSLSGVPAKCVTHRFQITVKARGSRVRIVVAIDGRRVRAARTKSLRLTISARRAKRGPHRIRATAIDRFGRRASKSRTFVRCATG